MKKKSIWVLALIFNLIGCTPSTSDEIIETIENQYPVQFSIYLDKEILPFPQTRNMPTLDVSEPILKNETDEPSDPPSDIAYTQLEYIVYQADNLEKPFKHITYRSDDDDFDFGYVYDTLPQGRYQIVFLAHSSDGGTLSATQMTFPKISDTFHKIVTIEFPSTNQEVPILLERIVSKIIFVSSEAIPNGMECFEIKVTPYIYMLDVLTGYGIYSSNFHVFTYSFSPNQVGLTNNTHDFFTLISEEQKTIHADLSAIGSNGQILRQREVDITPLANQMIRYTGNLYTPTSSNNQFSVEISNDGEWKEIIENELPN